jgi:hypothetical protein
MLLEALYTSKTRLRADARQLVRPAGLGQPAVKVAQILRSGTYGSRRSCWPCRGR